VLIIQLNNLAIENKFLIPLISDLMDELHGFQFFSKQDIRFSYHQVRLYKEDVDDCFKNSS
jgi:hypothetical protein